MLRSALLTIAYTIAHSSSLTQQPHLSLPFSREATDIGLIRQTVTC